MIKVKYSIPIETKLLYNKRDGYRGDDWMELNVGEIIKLKKQHPCGSSEWEILRVGMDFRLKCLGCGHMIMIPRKQVEKNMKSVRKPDQ